MRAYAVDLRERIVRAVDEGCTAEEAAALFDVSAATVRRYLRQRRVAGSLVPKTSPGRPRLIGPREEGALLAQLAAQPDGLLEEHCRQWQARTQRVVSVATMCRALARLHLPRKKRPSTRRSKTPQRARLGAGR